MRHLEWEGLGVKVDDFYLHSLRLADDILVIKRTSSRQNERIDRACGKIGMRLNLRKTMFMRNGLVADDPLMLSGTSSREVNMMIDVAPELRGRERAAWGTLENIEEDSEHLAPRLPFRQCCPSCFEARLQNLGLRKKDEHDVSVTERALEGGARNLPVHAKRNLEIHAPPSSEEQITLIRAEIEDQVENNDDWTGAATD
ncbi:unnamed protein product [Haemonchus placei]|uniref:Reverse transcriptase domain-containing protein n=1 Tax=Haemonchus placei TaxID=6290 RepID=A0A0N4WZC1_HAEPC|nr:unnamed protein product [Haemonchus placei]